MTNGRGHDDNWGAGGFIHLMDLDALPGGARWRKPQGVKRVKVDTPLPLQALRSLRHHVIALQLFPNLSFGHCKVLQSYR